MPNPKEELKLTPISTPPVIAAQAVFHGSLEVDEAGELAMRHGAARTAAKL